ncbi:MAG: PIN domain-containing protein [Acidobacteriota bacterium]
MIFVDTGFFFALFAIEERARHTQARQLLSTMRGRKLSDMLITTDHIVLETLTLIQTTVKRNAHARAVFVGEKLYAERLARIYRTNFEEQVEAFAYLKQHRDKPFSAVDCLSFVVMLKLGIQEAWTFDGHFTHRFVARPGPKQK